MIRAIIIAIIAGLMIGHAITTTAANLAHMEVNGNGH
jgi:hypothetical protein